MLCQQVRDGLVFFAPDAVQPLLQFSALAGIGLHQFGRDGVLLHVYHHIAQTTAQGVDEGGHFVGVDDGHVDQAGEQLAHGAQCDAHAAGLGIQQMLVRRRLLRVLGSSESRAFGKAHHRRPGA